MTWSKAIEVMVETDCGVQLPGWPDDCFVYCETQDDEKWPCWQDGEEFDQTLAMVQRKDWEIAEGAIIPPPRGFKVGLRPVL